MARIRTIKPEFCQSESTGRLSRDARLLFIQLWTICDDEGRCRGNDRILSGLLYPFDEDAFRFMSSWIHELEKENCIYRYVVDGNTYIEICKWVKHQKIDRPSPSRIPKFDESHRGPDEVHRANDADLGPWTLDQGPVPRTVVPLSSTSAELDPRELSECVNRVFSYYLEKTGRDGKRYTLSEERRRKANSRLKERAKIHGSLEQAENDAVICIENLAASDYHREKGYVDWTDQIFRSKEEFEKRLNWNLKANGGNGNVRKSAVEKNLEDLQDIARRLDEADGGSNRLVSESEDREVDPDPPPARLEAHRREALSGEVRDRPENRSAPGGLLSLAACYRG